MLAAWRAEPKHSNELFVPIDITPDPLPADIELPPTRFFPPPTWTTHEGLLCVGGRLSPEWLLDAYRHGIFPWPMWEDEPIAWWSPDPRAIIQFDKLHVSRRLRRTIDSGKFRVTYDEAFAAVIEGCATAGDRRKNTWLTPAMIAAYSRMHALGHAHSVEVWLDPPRPPREGRNEGVLELLQQDTLTPNPSPKGRAELVGGTYGLAIGGLFAAESMFHRERDASKVAVVYLVERLQARGFQLLDIQQWTPHTGTLGATELPRLEYLKRLANAIAAPVNFGD